MQGQAETLGLPLTFFQAVNGREPNALFAHVNPEKRMAYKGRPFKPGEIGCWASHYLLWQRCLESGKPMIVLEDDVVIDPGLQGLVRSLPQLPEGIDYFRLHASDDPSREWATFAGLSIHRYWRSPMGSFGYYLAPAAAGRFLRHAQEWILPVDNYMDLAWLHGVECLGLKPGLIHTPGDFESTISADGRGKIKLGPKALATREAFRLWLHARWSLHNLPARLARDR